MRFFHPYVRAHSGWRGVSSLHRGDVAYTHRQSGDAAGGRVHFRFNGGSLRTSAAVDARRALLFDHRDSFWVRAELHRVPDSAAVLRNRHGRRMGRGCVAGNGIGPREVARNALRRVAGGICAWKSAGRASALDHFPALGLARDVFHRRLARAADAIHPTRA